MVRPEFLPKSKLLDLVALLQAGTSLGEFVSLSVISCPVLLYYTDDWAANPYGIPFSPDYCWPCGRLSFGERFFPPSGWADWVSQMFSFVEGAPESRKIRYKRALRWFAESAWCDSLCDRMMKLFIALEVLYLGDPKPIRGKGQIIAEKCFALLHSDPVERRRWRKFITGAYEKVRSLLFHEGTDEEKLAQVLKESMGLNGADECADMLEIAFRLAWNAFFLRNKP